MRKKTAYLLTHDVARFTRYETDYQADLKIENVPLSDRLDIFGEKPFAAPNPVIYRGYPPIVKAVDFPVTDNSWTVVSRRMLDALKAVGDFPHLEFPVVILDSREPRDRWFNGNGDLRDDLTLKNYAAIQLTEHLDIFDFEKSKYARDEDFPEYVGDVREYVFKIPHDGLPPIFHVKGVFVKLFVSHEARRQLKKAKITGIEYVSLKGFKRGGSFVDVLTPTSTED